MSSSFLSVFLSFALSLLLVCFYSLLKHRHTFNYDSSPLHCLLVSVLLVFWLRLWKPQRRHAPVPFLWFPAGCRSGWLSSSPLPGNLFLTTTITENRPGLLFRGCLEHSEGGNNTSRGRRGWSQPSVHQGPALTGLLYCLCGSGFRPFLFLSTFSLSNLSAIDLLGFTADDTVVTLQK